MSSWGSVTALGKKTTLQLIVTNFVFICVGPCPIILIMPQVFNICTIVLASATERSFHLPSFSLHSVNSIEKCLKFCLDRVKSVIFIFSRQLHSAFIPAGTFKCLYSALLQDVDFFFLLPTIICEWF